MHHGDRTDARIDRLFVARDDGLKCHDQLASHGHRVNAVVRQSGMAAFAVNGDFEFVARRHDRARAHGKSADLGTRPVVHSEHGLHGEFFKHAVFDHFTGTAAAFFSGLEDQIHGAVKVAML